MKRKLLMTILIPLSFFVYAQGLELTSINASWRAVLPGKVMSEPQLTKSGFAVITDAKTLMSFTSGGRLIWEKRLYKPTGAFFSVLDNGFIAVITNSGTRLTVLNPDGNEVWHTDTDAPIINPPMSGRDGRFFVSSLNSVSCYGITGIKKWQADTPELMMTELQELPDGSLICFLKKLSDRKSVALRISPFGEILEQITFAGEVRFSLTTSDGVFLTFTDGTSGLFALEDGKSRHKWLFQKQTASRANRDFFILSQNKKDVIYVNHQNAGLSMQLINTADGSINSSFLIPELHEALVCWCNDSGILAADSKTAYFYNNAGRFIWSGVMPQKNSREYYTHLLFTTDNDFVLFGKNWSANAFRVSNAQAQQQDKADTQRDSPGRRDYSAFYTINTAQFDTSGPMTLGAELTGDERRSELKAGLYGTNETLWASELISALTQNKAVMLTADSRRAQKTVFETDTAGVERLYLQTGLYGTDTFNDFISYFLRNERNKSLLKQLLAAVRENPYDPDGSIMAAIEVLASRLTERDELLIQEVCDTVGAVCAFMGYSAIEPRGKSILGDFMYPQYHAATRTYARKTLQNLTAKQ